MKRPTLHIIRTVYPDLAGAWMRNLERAGLLVKYRHSQQRGFFIVAVYPRWRWLTRLVFWCWLHRRALRGLANIAALVAFYILLLSLGGRR